MSKVTLFLLVFATVVFSSCRDETPEAKFQYEVLTGGKVIFTNTTSGLVEDYVWTFGDGDSSLEASPVHNYRSSGTYAVNLYVSGETGRSRATESVTIVMDDFNPVEGHVTFEDADGIVYATNKYRYYDDDLGNRIEEKYGEATAAFYDNEGFFVSAGIVAANGNDLELKTNNTYRYSALDSANISGDTLFYFAGDVNWSIYGANDFPTILETIRQEFPLVSEINKNDPSTDPEEIDVTTDYAMTTTPGIIGADSILFQIVGNNGEVLLDQINDGSQNTHIFSSDDLKTLPKGDVELQIVAFNYESRVYRKKLIYFVNEATTTRKAIIK